MKKLDAFIGYADVISPLGWGVDNNIEKILSGKSAYTKFNSSEYGEDFPVKYWGNIPLDLIAQNQYEDYSKSELILDQLLKRLPFNKKEITIDAIFLLYKNLNAFEFYRNKGLKQKNFFIKNDQLSVSSLLKKNGINIPFDKIHIIDNTCCTGLTLLTNATQGVSANIWNNVLVCAIDLMDPYVLFSLNGIGAFPQVDIEPDQASRPFDIQRNGFVKTESGSIALVTKNKNQLNNTDFMKIVSFNQTNDAYRMTDGREDTLYIRLAMESAISRSGLSYEQIGFIKAHGTGTLLNDLNEANAIDKVFNDYHIPVTSLKGHLGHTTDASGLIENIIAGQSLKKGFILPTKNYVASEFKINIVKEKTFINHTPYFLSNSFGFGGNNISAVIEVTQ